MRFLAIIGALVVLALLIYGAWGAVDRLTANSTSNRRKK